MVRGVPLSADGTFFEPLLTDSRDRGRATGIIDWFTLLVGLFALAALSMHGGLWLALKTTGSLRERSRIFRASRSHGHRRARRPRLRRGLECAAPDPAAARRLTRPAIVLTLLAVVGLAGAWRFSGRGVPESHDARAFSRRVVFLAALSG